jgi:hypothetical protein
VRENKRYDKVGEIWREKIYWRKKEEERQRDNRKMAEKGCQERKIEKMGEAKKENYAIEKERNERRGEKIEIEERY